MFGFYNNAQMVLHFKTITEGEGPPVDSTSLADMADFDDLFHSLGYTENDPNWTGLVNGRWI